MNCIYSMKEFMDTDFGELKFIHTNCTCIDEMTNGLVEDGIHLITGGSGQGKSLILMHLAVNIANTKPLLYISLENDIRIDKARMSLANNKYKIDVDKSALFYVNGIDEGKGITKNAKKISGLLEYIETCNDMVVVIDAPEYLSNSKDGMESYQNGKDLLEKLKVITTKNHITLIMSWQLQRGIPRDISEFSVDYLSASMAAARIASSVWAVHKSQGSTKMKLLKCRTEINKSFDTTYTIGDTSNRYDIRGVAVATNPSKEDLKKQLGNIAKGKR